MSQNIVKKKSKKLNKQLILWTVLFFFILLGVFSAYFIASREEVIVGQVANADVQANRYMTVEDKVATKAKEDLALEGFQEIYALNLDDYNNLTIAEISDFFNIVEEIVLGEVPEGIVGEHISIYKVS